MWFMFTWCLCSRSFLWKTTGKARKTVGYFSSLEMLLTNVVGDMMLRSRHTQDLYLRQKSWDILTNRMWVARKRKEFWITPRFLVLSPLWYSFQQFTYMMVSVYWEKTGINNLQKAGRWVWFGTCVIWDICERWS